MQMLDTELAASVKGTDTVVDQSSLSRLRAELIVSKLKLKPLTLAASTPSATAVSNSAAGSSPKAVVPADTTAAAAQSLDALAPVLNELLHLVHVHCKQCITPLSSALCSSCLR